MSVLEIKNLLHKAIANAEDETFLKVLLFVVQTQQQELLTWESLPIDVKQDIQDGIAQLDAGERKDHALMIDKYKAWLQA